MLFPLIVILHLILFLNVSAEPRVVYKTRNIECETCSKYTANASCFLKAINWNRAVAHMDVEIVIPLLNPSIQIELFKRGYSNQYYPVLINVVFNICEIISKRNHTLYGIILWKIIKEYTNVNHSCPYTGHLIAKNLYIDENYVPVLPLGFYKFNLSFYENFSNRPREPIGTVQFHFQTMEMVKTKRKN